MKQNILKYLTDPSKVASRLDWKKASGSVLAIDVGSDRMGLAVAVHPSQGNTPLPLKALPIKLETRSGNQRALCDSVIEDLQTIVKNYNVCGFVVSWPMQKEGRCGAPCGKVLHTLDSLVEESSAIVNSNRPFCLWDEHHYMPNEDQWGRTPQYSHCTKNKALHLASKEQYVHECSSSIAVDVWNDYCSKHWPHMTENEYEYYGHFCDDEEDDDDGVWLEAPMAANR